MMDPCLSQAGDEQAAAGRHHPHGAGHPGGCGLSQVLPMIQREQHPSPLTVSSNNPLWLLSANKQKQTETNSVSSEL